MGDNSKKPGIRFKGFTDDWEQRKLGDVANFLDTIRKPLEGAKRIPGPYPYYGASGIVDFVDGYLFDEELVLLSEDGANITDRNYPVCFLATGKYWVNNHAHVLKIKGGNENNFVCNSLEQKDYKKYNSGMAMPKLNQEICREIPILCPNYNEQKKIGDFFRNLDNLITLHQRKYDKLVVIKKSMLEKMFPKNGQTKPEIRFSGFTDDWEQRKLGEIITEYKETVDSECTLPILTSSKTEGVILQEEHFGRKQQHDITGYNILPRNYCTYRNRSDGVDFTFNINKCCDKGIISKFYPVFSGKNSDVFFLSLVLNNSDEVVREIAYTCTGTGQKVLSFLDLQKMKVRVPSYDEQKEIAAYFENLDHLITLHQRELEKLKKIKLSMLEKMFV
jgi:type I restriction enzyme S subunit